MAADPRELLRRHFGFPGFRPGQEELVRAVLAGRDALGVLPTGGGKSVCYQIPALALGGLTLVVTPLVSLMQDQVRRAVEGGLRGEYLSATRTTAEKRTILEAARTGGLDILFVAPERLELDRFQDELRRLDVRLLAVDEAHCISEWGHEFRPCYRRIGRLRGLLSCPTLALTATATPDVRDDVVDSLELRDPLVVVRSFDRPNLSWTVVRERSMAGRVLATYRVLARRPGPAIVYAPTRATVESVRDRLAGFGVAAQAYHAGLSGAARTAVQDTFMGGGCRVVVATNAFGMGIDKADVRTVVHVALPSTLEAYYQEAGRAGRDGLDSACATFYAPADLRFARDKIRLTHPSRRILGRALRRLGRWSRSPGPDADRLTADHIADPPAASAIMEALKRLGAVRPVEPLGAEPGTDPIAAGFHETWAYVDHRIDPAPLLLRRDVVLGKLKAVKEFATTRGCRRRALLRYFGERAAARCGRCDRCRRTPLI
jgi:ATP-dependent DNA helicase RecQ